MQSQRFSYQGSNQSIGTNSSHLVERKLTNSSDKPPIVASKHEVISTETSAMTDLIQDRKDITRSSVSHSSPTKQGKQH